MTSKLPSHSNTQAHSVPKSKHQSYHKRFEEFERYRTAVTPMDIPEFRGGIAPLEISVEMFVHIVDSLKEAYGWSDNVTGGKVFDKLYGEAAKWRWTSYYEVIMTNTLMGQTSLNGPSKGFLPVWGGGGG